LEYSIAGASYLVAVRQRTTMLSPQRAFVIHLDSSTDPSAHHPVGRVEHVPSGESAHFRSLTDLLAFFARYVGDEGPADAGPESERR
jgi:hypothetical protein